MKFVRVFEDFEIHVPDEGYKIVKAEGHINLDNIGLIRIANDGTVLVFLVGRDKALKISDQDSVDKLLKECKISKKVINE